MKSKKLRKSDTVELSELIGKAEAYDLATEARRRGGRKGGAARSRSMTAKQRTESARKAANARWGNHG